MTRWGKHGIQSTLLAAIGSSLIALSTVHADTWRTVTSGWSVDELVAVGDTVWCGADGGLLMADASSGKMTLFNRDDGLTELTVTELAWDSAQERLWLGFSDGTINLFDPKRERVVTTISDFAENVDVTGLKDIELRDGVAWVLTNIGLSKLEPVDGVADRWVVRQNYRQLASWTASVNFTETAVWHNQVFVGSDLGVVRASLSDDLRIPSNWQLYDWQTDLGTTQDAAEAAYLLENVQDTLVLSSARGAWTFTGNAFVPFGNVGRIYSLAFFDDDSVAVTNWDGLRLYDSSLQGGYLVASPLTLLSRGIAKVGDQLWVGMQAGRDGPGGLMVRDPQAWELVRPSTIGGDRVGSIDVADDGDVWVASNRGSLAGVYRLHEGTWIPYTNYNTPGANFNPYASMPSVHIDRAGNVWVGSYGGGLNIIVPSTTGEDSVYFYDRYNSPLQGYSSDETDPFVNVLDFADDPSGGLWMSNGVPYDGYALLYVPAEWISADPSTRDPNDWIRIGAPQGMTDGRVGTLAVDQQGRVWIGYPREETWPGDTQPSLMVYDPAGTPTVLSDDSFQKFSWSSDIPYVTGMAFDQEGLLWLATPNGLFSVDVNQPLNLIEAVAYTGAVSTFSFDVAVDPLDQVWVTTDFGVSVLGRDRYTWIRNYTTDQGPYPSPIATDQVDAVAFNAKTGEAWLGTNEGISVVTTPFRDFSDQPQEFVVAPQPLLVGNGGNGPLLFSSSSLSAGATVRIYTPSGRLVRELNFETAALGGWDGKDDKGNWASSGVYLVVVTASNGNSITGKVAVVRK